MQERAHQAHRESSREAPPAFLAIYLSSAVDHSLVLRGCRVRGRLALSATAIYRVHNERKPYHDLVLDDIEGIQAEPVHGASHSTGHQRRDRGDLLAVRVNRFIAWAEVFIPFHQRS